MLLRTLAGRYAGEVQEYPFHVGQEALRSGTAELPGAAPEPTGVAVAFDDSEAAPPPPAVEPPPSAIRIAGRREKRRRSR